MGQLEPQSFPRPYFSKFGVPGVLPPRNTGNALGTYGSLGALGGETAGTPNFENTQVAISEKLWGMEF